MIFARSLRGRSDRWFTDLGSIRLTLSGFPFFISIRQTLPMARGKVLGDGDIKGAPPFCARLHPGPAPVLFGHFLHDGKTQPGTLNASGILSTHENAEDLLCVVSFYPGAVVLYKKEVTVFLFAIPDVNVTQLCSTVFERIIHQISEYSGEGKPVGVKGRYSVRFLPVYLTDLELRRKILPYPVEDLFDIYGLDVKREFF
jgi:hypothetical protein